MERSDKSILKSLPFLHPRANLTRIQTKL
uniref:Uncharacterized protein n=1 Tax=Tetranychus urticae TaxID=32264 RepID=T1K6B9_TETUR